MLTLRTRILGMYVFIRLATPTSSPSPLPQHILQAGQAEGTIADPVCDCARSSANVFVVSLVFL